MRNRAIVIQQKTGRHVQFELMDDARTSLLVWLTRRGGVLDDATFPVLSGGRFRQRHAFGNCLSPTAPTEVIPDRYLFASYPSFRQLASMRKTYASNEDYFRDMRSLIEGLCDRRCLHSLSILLPAFMSFNGMTDGWGELVAALKGLAAACDGLTEQELETVLDLLKAGESALYRR